MTGSDGELMGYAPGLTAEHKLLPLEENTAGVIGIQASLSLFRSNKF
ncbi:MAG: hypothetical protein MJK13_16295 [Pseudomonadales bacterium]|nr:hypothetical protein [Pseudomonadales bacterium]